MDSSERGYKTVEIPYDHFRFYIKELYEGKEK